jgi:PPM family protein phosphatase
VGQTIAMKIAARGLTDTGRKRDHNEDSFCVDVDLGLFVVADGMGGHAGGGTASRLAVQAIEEQVRNTRAKSLGEETVGSGGDGTELRNTLVETVREACRSIFKQAQSDPALTGMGTTVTAVQVDGETALVAHVGDSRCYLARGGRIYQITEDHSLVNEQLKAGAITAEEARNSRFKNIITRSVGFEENVQVDAVSLVLEVGDRLVICSDGLSNLVQDDEIREVVTDAALDRAPDKLVDLANARGGDDNITVVVVRTEADQAADDPVGGGAKELD